MLVATLALALLAQGHSHRASPFDAVRWPDAEPQVRVDGTWYRPLAVDGVAVDEILTAIDGRSSPRRSASCASRAWTRTR